MLKNNTFSASIFKGFGNRFGRVFGRFFGSKMHANSDLKKSVRQAKSIGKTNTKSMSALLRQRLFRVKIFEITCLLGHCFQRRFGWILEGFWEAKSLDFGTFFVIFSKQILKDFLEG